MVKRRRETDKENIPPINTETPSKKRLRTLPPELANYGIQSTRVRAEAVLAEGNFKAVFAGKLDNAKPIALSTYLSPEVIQEGLDEAKIMVALKHPNVVNVEGITVPNDNSIIVLTELCTRGDLYDAIRRDEARGDAKLITIMKDIASGLAHIHSKGIIHRDIKSSNILVTEDFRAKITDFGLATTAQPPLTEFVGTPVYVAPEMIPEQGYDNKVDVYACAMVFYELLQWRIRGPDASIPHEGLSHQQIYRRVVKNRLRPKISHFRRRYKAKFIEPLLDLIEDMWAHNPKDRPTMATVVKKLTKLV